MSILIHRPCCNFNPFSDSFPPSPGSTIFNSIASIPKTPKPLRCSFGLRKFRRSHLHLCPKIEAFDEFNNTLEEEPESLELLSKPSPKQAENGPIDEVEVEGFDKEEALEPFYKFFKPLGEENIRESEVFEDSVKEETQKVNVEYYEPKAGDFAVGVVVSGNENRLDVNVGADMLGIMLTKDVLPFYGKEMEYLLCDLDKDAEEFMVPGKVGIVRHDEAMGRQPLLGRPVVELGTVLFAEVLGRTLGGRPLLSSRRVFRRIAWHRVRQIKQMNEPIEVKITEWNTGGLLTRIEGLRAFLPKAELMNRVNNYTELKENVGRRVHVLINRINEDTNDLVLSEKDAWEMTHLQEGRLLVGTVKTIFPYGAQIRIGDTNRSGLLHISKISRERIASVTDVLAINEEVKVLVVKSMFPGKISLSIADLESEPGLFLSNKERVFAEAKEMAKKYRKISLVTTLQKSEALPVDGLPFEDEEKLYANWKWLKFERVEEET